jgi:hypothetical protein
VARVFLGYLAPSDGPGLRRYVESHEARTVVVDWFDADKIAGFLAPLHPKRAEIDRLVFFRLPA